jgi:hypothetical protein
MNFPGLSPPKDFLWLEYLAVDTPLGLRFWDRVRGGYIGEGLIVTGFLKARPDWPMTARPNRSGIFVFHSLSARCHEKPAGVSSTPQSLTVNGLVVCVYDELGRFLPFRFSIDDPTRGLFSWNGPVCSPVSPPAAYPLMCPVQSVPLFSSPVRIVPDGMTAVRADLRRISSANPEGVKAAWAVMEVIHKGRTLGCGMADSKGRAAVILPYPQPLISNSLPSGAGSVPPLHKQCWTIDLRVRFRPPDETIQEAEEAVLRRHPERTFPDLDSAFRGDVVTLLNPAGADGFPGALRLEYGWETIVKTAGKSGLFFMYP